MGVVDPADRQTESRANLRRLTVVVFCHPIGSLLYTISCMHCMTVSLAQGGDGLGAMWGKEMAVRYLQDAGFHSVEVHELAHDFQNYYYVCRP